MRLARLTATGFSICLLSGCSWVTTFAVVNETDSTIDVSYTLAAPDGSKLPPCPDDQFIEKPRVRLAAELDDPSTLGASLPPSQFQCDPATRTVSIRLMPRHAVLLFWELNHTGYRTEIEQEKHFHYPPPIVRLAIHSDHGGIEYSGSQLTRDFIKKRDSLYLLTYQ